jgi:hypothetical protein
MNNANNDDCHSLVYRVRGSSDEERFPIDGMHSIPSRPFCEKSHTLDRDIRNCGMTKNGNA